MAPVARVALRRDTAGDMQVTDVPRDPRRRSPVLRRSVTAGAIGPAICAGPFRPEDCFSRPRLCRMILLAPRLPRGL